MNSAAIALSSRFSVTSLPSVRTEASHASVAAVNRPAVEAGAPDEALMGAYLDGNERAFVALFQRHGPLLHRFFQRSFHSVAVADDLVQTTFMKLHRARESYRPGSPVRPWLYAIAGHVRTDELRRRYGQRLALSSGAEDDDAFERAVEQLSATTSVAPEAELQAAELAERVRAALDRLPEPQRVVVQLHRYEGLTFSEIATMIGSTEGAVKLRAFRAYEKLRQDLADLARPERR